MRPSPGFRCWLVAGLLLACLSARAAEPLRVLFVGNSQMYTCNLPRMVQELADSAPADAPRLEVGRAILGGRGLQGYWEAGEEAGRPRAMIATGGWQVVILQEAYDIWDEPFDDYVARFHALVQASGARSLLFATASISDLFPDGFRKLNEPQLAWGRAHGVACAAAGYAWLDYLGAAPDRERLLDLYSADRKHPGPKGTYLYACLLYAHLTGKNPAGLTHTFAHLGGEIMSDEEATRMQTVAWARYQEDIK